MGAALEKLGISGVWGVRPAWPRVMSYPALTEKPVVGGPMGGAERTGPSGGPADGGVKGAPGPAYGPLRPRGDDTEPRERGGGGSVEGTGLENPPGENAEMLEGTGLVNPPGANAGMLVGLEMVGGPETPEHKKRHAQIHA